MQLFDAKKLAGAPPGRPGEVIAIDDAGMTVAAEGGHIQVTRVRAGGPKITASEFARNTGLRVGARLGSA